MPRAVRRCPARSCDNPMPCPLHATEDRRPRTRRQRYGHKHENERRRWMPVVMAGEAECAELVCLEVLDGRTRWLDPDEPWQLAHDRRTPGKYLGPAHPRCNESEGAVFGNQSRGQGVKSG